MRGPHYIPEPTEPPGTLTLRWLRRLRGWGGWAAYLGIVLWMQASGHWSADSGTPPPHHFTVVLAGAQDGKLDFVALAFLEETVERRRAQDEDSLFVLPTEAITRHPTPDMDLTLTVRELEPDAQLIEIGYEIGMTNHGWSRYRATAAGPVPIAAQEGDLAGIVCAIPVALVWVFAVTVVIVLVRVGLWVRWRIS